MKASEAAKKLCPFSFVLREIPGTREGGPWECQTGRCMAWRIYKHAGDLANLDKNAGIPDGYEETGEVSGFQGSLRRIRAVEELGECHALPAIMS